MFSKILIISFFLILLLITGIWSPSSYAGVCNNSKHDQSTVQQSNYKKVRNILSASDQVSDSVDNVLDVIDKVDMLGVIPSKEISLFTKMATYLVKGGIYVEDGVHTLNTRSEIEHRINEVLNSSRVKNMSNNTELYEQFQKYVKTSLREWIPDRDYPKIGYLPKAFLLDPCLGEKEITKYWPEATKQEQDKYIALTSDELLSNYELFWNNLLKQSK